jgi:peroxiredoxin
MDFSSRVRALAAIASLVVSSGLYWPVAAWADDVECLEAAQVPGEFPSMSDLDGAEFDLGAVVAANHFTILYWYATGCPCVLRYQQRIEAIAETYAADGVAVLGVSSNADDDLAALRESIDERGFLLPVIRDDDGSLADQLGVRSTPTTVVLDSSGAVLFVGWIDNERQPGQSGREAWLEDALRAAIAGGSTQVVEAPTYGCPLTRRRGRHENCGTD